MQIFCTIVLVCSYCYYYYYFGGEFYGWKGVAIIIGAGQSRHTICLNYSKAIA
jgi:hypothetical protein